MEAILYRIKHLFGMKPKVKDMSSFFLDTSKKEREHILRHVVDLANKDQKKLVDEARKKEGQ